MTSQTEFSKRIVVTKRVVAIGIVSAIVGAALLGALTGEGTSPANAASNREPQAATTTTTEAPRTPRERAIAATSTAWAVETGDWSGLSDESAERFGDWAAGLATYITDGDALCDEMFRQTSVWADMAGVDGNGTLVGILHLWSPVVGVDIGAAWKSCTE